MHVTLLSRFHGGNHEMSIEAAKQLKPIVETNGAEMFSLVQFYAGANLADVMVGTRFPSWDVVGRANQSAHC